MHKNHLFCGMSRWSSTNPRFLNIKTFYFNTSTILNVERIGYRVPSKTKSIQTSNKHRQILGKNLKHKRILASSVKLIKCNETNNGMTSCWLKERHLKLDKKSNGKLRTHSINQFSERIWYNDFLCHQFRIFLSSPSMHATFSFVF